MSPPLDQTHDEEIVDEFYKKGWTECSTSELCKALTNRSCECMGSGSCSIGMFNHYLYQEGSQEPMAARYKEFPILLNRVVAEEISLEEIRCAPHTVGSSVRYYEERVIGDVLSNTMVSVAIGLVKSPCFNVACYVAEINLEASKGDSLCILKERGLYGWVLCHDGEVLDHLLKSLCVIGIDPVVSGEGNYEVLLQHDRHRGRPASETTQRSSVVNLSTSGFRLNASGRVNMIGKAPGPRVQKCSGSEVSCIRAVGTALVTISIVLEPKSMYGGKNPSTKKPLYVVHNVIFV